MRCALPALQSSRVRRSRQQLGYRPAPRARARSSRRERFEARAGRSDSEEGDVGPCARPCAWLGNRPGRPPGKRGSLTDAPEGSRPEATDVEHYGTKCKNEQHAYSRTPEQGIRTRTETRTEGDEGACPPAERFPGRCNPARASGAGNFIPGADVAPALRALPICRLPFRAPHLLLHGPGRSSYFSERAEVATFNPHSQVAGTFKGGKGSDKPYKGKKGKGKGKKGKSKGKGRGKKKSGKP